MPSFKFCFSTVAFMALAVAPLVSANAPSHNIVARDIKVARAAHASPVGITRRSSPEARALARAAAAQRALERRTLAYTGETGNVLSDTNESVNDASITCTNDATCTSSPDIQLFAGSTAVCRSGRCLLRCASGFRPTGLDQNGRGPPTTCEPGPDTCFYKKFKKTITCPPIVNGWMTCNAHGSACVPHCLKGWKRIPAIVDKGTTPASYGCYEVQHDPNACGGVGPAFICPTDYNSVPGSYPVCSKTKCKLSCPKGTKAVKTGNAEKPLACV